MSGIENNEQNTGAKAHALSHLSRTQLIVAVFLLFFAILTIFIWMNRFQSLINSNPGILTEEEQKIPSALLVEDNDDERLKELDTDRDTLSDWDELYVYKTSPYIDDSDSDGYSDGDEVRSGNNPNCPAGRSCDSNMSVSEEGFDEAPVIESPEVPAIPEGVGLDNISQDDEGIQKLVGGDIDAETLRRLLADYGMAAEYLDQVSDEELMKTYAEILKGE